MTMVYYYGRNDLRPMPLVKRLCLYTALLVLSPVVLLLLILYIATAFIIMQFVSMSDYQLKTGKLLAYEAWWKSPGILLEVKLSTTAAAAAARGDGTEESFDIIIPKDFVTGDGKSLNACRNLSLRKSIECTVQDHCRRHRCGNSKYGAMIENDRNRDEPHYLLHGGPGPYNPKGKNEQNNGADHQMWFTHARTATWAAIYSWTGQLAGGWTNWDQSIKLETAPDVFGYIYLFEVTNSNFYKEPRIIRVGGMTVNAPDHTPETEKMIFARYGYGEVKYMGDFPEGDPDAYIFRGERVLKEAKLKLLHQYRVMKPKSES